MSGGRAVAVRPEVQQMIDDFGRLEDPDFTDMEVDDARGLLSGPAGGELPPIHEQLDVEIDGPGGPLRLRIYRPSDEVGLPALMWFHGGGWVLGDIEAGDLPGRDLAGRASCVVASVDYRLAPETPFPGAFDDCMAATRWIVDHGTDMELDGSRVAVAGGSAGANLATAVAIEAALRDIALVGQVLAHPVTTVDLDSPSMIENATGYLLTRGGMRWFWDQYLQGADRRDRRAAPLDGLSDLPADALRRLAPAWIYTAGFDPLRDDGLGYGRALSERGVDVTAVHVDDVIHGVFSSELDCGEEARRAAADWLRRRFDPPTLATPDTGDAQR